MGAKKPKKGSVFLILVVVFVVMGITSLVVGLAFFKNSDQNSDTDSAESSEQTEAPEGPEKPEEPEPEPKPTRIDFQPVVDSWTKSVGGNRSVIIYDLDLGEVAASYNLDENYNTASLYKLFVVYEGYKRVSSGEWDANVKAGYTGKTILKCLDLSIRESNSTCAETLRGLIGWSTLDNIIKNEWGITKSNIPNLTSNANDIMLMMKRFYEHPDFNDTGLINMMWDSFLNQPPTEYDWRMGLPKGFSKATVYNKVGWDFDPDKKVWNIYHDAAIVKFPLTDGTTRNFIVVVMTNKVDYKKNRELGTLLENDFYQKVGV